MSTEWEHKKYYYQGSKEKAQRVASAGLDEQTKDTQGSGQRWNTWRRVQGSAAAAAKPRFRGGRSLFPTRTPTVAGPRVHNVRRHPCLELSSARSALRAIFGESTWVRTGDWGLCPRKKGAGNAATPDTEVPEISGNELRQELWGWVSRIRKICGYFIFL